MIEANESHLSFHLISTALPGNPEHWNGVFVVDGHALSDENDTVNWCDVFRSAFVSGDYYPNTCICGDPGCAGYTRPTRISHHDEQIIWHETHFLGVTLRFNRAQYQAALTEILAEMNAFLPYVDYEWEIACLAAGRLLPEPVPDRRTVNVAPFPSVSKCDPARALPSSKWIRRTPSVYSSGEVPPARHS